MDNLVHLILLSGLVFFPGSLEDNIAIKGNAVQSSTFLTWAAQSAIDGRRYGAFEVFCSVTAYELNPWWRLDLLQNYQISTVLLTSRSDGNLEQINGAEIRIGNSLENNGNNNPICAVTSGFLASQTLTYSCHGMEGRYVNVVIPGRASYLTLCEVEVYDTDNLAFNGTVTQSSAFLNRGAELAVDGTRYDSNPKPQCSTTSSESNPWWRLDLVNNYDISTVIITARSEEYAGQTNGAEIRIGNSLANNGNNNPICDVTSGFLTGYTLTYSCHGMDGRYVNVVMTGRTSFLSLCEVEVYGKPHRKKNFLRLKFSSSGDVEVESDKILHQLQSTLALTISDFKLSWTQIPKKEEEQEEEQKEDGSRSLC